MLVSDFHYDLPGELIAQHPPAVRGASRMMTLSRTTGDFADSQFADLPQLLQPGDLLILNDSRVLPARLYATRSGLRTQHNSPAPTGQVEILLTQRVANSEAHNDWTALVKPAKKVQPGETLHFHATNQGAPCPDSGTWEEELPLLTATVTAAGEHRDRYQTVFSRERGSAAAPTAGLHFTPEILAALRQRGVEVQTLTLHVGLGTFQPVRAERTEDIRLHAEPYTLPAATAAAIVAAQSESRRIIAVGTTTTRTLEHIARLPGPIAAHSGSTSLFLSPGLNDEFKLVRGLLTNFHLPSSTLLMLVSAFAGREAVLRAYTHAVAAHYRFFSYGDCMLIL